MSLNRFTIMMNIMVWRIVYVILLLRANRSEDIYDHKEFVTRYQFYGQMQRMNMRTLANHPIGVVKEDSFNMGNIYFGHGASLKVLNKAGRISTLAGTPGDQGDSTDGDIASSSTKLRAPVCLLQRANEELLIMEKHCLRAIDFRRNMLSTLVGDCNLSPQEFETGPFSDRNTLLGTVNSCVFGENTDIYIQDNNASAVGLINLGKELVAKLSFFDQWDVPSSITMNWNKTDIFSFTKNRVLEKTDMLYGYKEEIAFISYDITQSDDLRDGDVNETQLASDPSEISNLFMDPYDELIIFGEASGTLRVIDLKTGYVSSICNGSYRLVLDGLKACSAGQINSVIMMSSTQMIIIGTESDGLLMIKFRRDLQDCVWTEDCLYHDPSLQKDASFDIQECDVTLRHCVHRADDDDESCPDGEQAMTQYNTLDIDDSTYCYRPCAVDDDCPFSQVCFESRCSIPGHVAVWCQEGCHCLVTPPSREGANGQTLANAKQTCHRMGDETDKYVPMRIKTQERKRFVEQIVPYFHTITNEIYSEFYLTGASVDSNAMVWVAETDHVKMGSNEPFNNGTLYGHICKDGSPTTQEWSFTLNYPHLGAYGNVVCDFHQDPPYNLELYDTHMYDYTDPFGRDEDQSIYNVYYQRVLPGCRSALRSNDSNITSTLFDVYTASKVGPIQILMHRLALCDIYNLTDTLRIRGPVVELIDNETIVFDCEPNRVTSQGINETTGRCLSGDWVIDDDCIFPNYCNDPVKEVPLFARLQDSTDHDDIFEPGEIITVDCLTDLHQPYGLHVFTCIADGTWYPSIPSTLPRCIHPIDQAGSTIWDYFSHIGLCVGISKADYTQPEATMICSNRLGGELVRVISAGADHELREIYAKTHSETEAIGWISGKYTGSQFVHADGTVLNYTNFTQSSPVFHDDSCLILTHMGWEGDDCTSRDHYPFACQTPTATRRPVDGWSHWSQWTSCTEQLTRERVRHCRQDLSYDTCPICVGPEEEEQICCRDPGFSTNTLRDGGAVQYPGATMTYECIFGYRVTGLTGVVIEQTIECLSDGKWDSTPSDCEVLACDINAITTPPDTNSYIWQGTNPPSVYTVNSIVYRTCNDSSYILPDDQLGTRHIRCALTAEWTDTNVKTCIPMPCGSIPTPPNAIVSNLKKIEFLERDPGILYYTDQIDYVCNWGYNYRGYTEFAIACLDDGKFSDDQPECIRSSCEVPPLTLPAFTSMNRSELPILSGQSVRLTCDKSYAINGVEGTVRQQILCIGLNFWNLTAILPCQALTCPVYPPGTHTDTVDADGRLAGDRVYYLCPVGMFDNATKQEVTHMECLANYTWSGDPAYCVDVYCDDPEIKENSRRIVGGFNIRDTITYKCNPGYILSGSTETIDQLNLTCQGNGRWDYEPITCISTAPYYSLRLDEIKDNIVTFSFIQAQAYDSVSISYHFRLRGTNDYMESVVLDEVFVKNQGAKHSINFKAAYGYKYQTLVRTVLNISGDLLDSGFIPIMSDIEDFYIPTKSPALLTQANIYNAKPIISKPEGIGGREKSYQDTVRATVNLPFTDEHGKVRKMSIIVCEVISYIPHSYYDRKLQRLLPTYKQAIPENPASVWECYQTTEDCGYGTPGDCQAWHIESGYIDLTRVTTIQTDIGTESCDGTPQGQYCNGYLKDVSTFCVRLRVYTQDDYFDSPCSEHFYTTPKWESGLAVALFLSLVPSVILFVVGFTLKQYVKGLDWELKVSDSFSNVDWGHNRLFLKEDLYMSDSKRLSGNLKESVVIDPGYTSGESEDDDSEDEDPPIERVESKKFMRRLSVGEQPSPKESVSLGRTSLPVINVETVADDPPPKVTPVKIKVEKAMSSVGEQTSSAGILSRLMRTMSRPKRQPTIEQGVTASPTRFRSMSDAGTSPVPNSQFRSSNDAVSRYRRRGPEGNKEAKTSTKKAKKAKKRRKKRKTEEQKGSTRKSPKRVAINYTDVAYDTHRRSPKRVPINYTDVAHVIHNRSYINDAIQRRSLYQ